MRSASPARLGLVGRYSVEAAFGELSVAYSAPEADSRELNQRTASAGVRIAQGMYPKFRAAADGRFQVDRYDRRDLDVSARVEPTGIGTFDLRLSLSRTTYDLATQRDFPGRTRVASWFWGPSGKLRLATTLRRDTGQDSWFNDSTRANTGVDVSRLTMALGLRADDEYSPKIGFAAKLGLGANWTPTRTTEQRRAAGLLSFDYSGNTVGCHGQITLQ